MAGATGGIGQAICRSLARDGFGIVVGYHAGRDRADSLVASLTADGTEAMAVRVDLAEQTSVEALAEAAIHRFGAVGTVVHAASPPIDPMTVVELTWADVQAHLDAGARGGLCLAQAVLPAMRAQKFGRIVFVYSV